MSSPFYCLFYSYKGGVGRTSALMNVAKCLVKRKKRVLLLDFDLPAPGVDIFDVADEQSNLYPSYNAAKYYLYRQLSHQEKEPNEQSGGIMDNWDKLKVAVKENNLAVPLGFVEFAKRYLEATKEHPDDLKCLPELSMPGDLLKDIEAGKDKERFLYKLPKESFSEGDLLVMRAGAHELDTYSEDLAYVNQNWSLLDKCEGDVADQTENAGNFIEGFRHQVRRLEVDYVLVDCKPGMEDLTKSAIKWFAQSAVLVFNLNPWNTAGIVEGYDLISKSILQKDAPNILLLASQIPPHAINNRLYANQYSYIAERMKNARNASKDDGEGTPVEVPVADILLLRDVLISDIAPDDLACIRYQQLANLIITGNGQDIENSIQQALAEGEPDKIDRAFDLLFREFRNSIPLTHAYAVYLLTMGKAQDAIEYLAKVKELIEQSSKNALLLTKGGDGGSAQEADDSPYHRDVAYHYARATAMFARQLLDGYLKQIGAVPSEQLASFVPSKNHHGKIDDAIMDLQRILIGPGVTDSDARSHSKENTDNDKKASGDSPAKMVEKDQREFADYLAVQAELYHLKANIIKAFEQSPYQIAQKSADKQSIKAALEAALNCIEKALSYRKKAVEYIHERARIMWRLAAENGNKSWTTKQDEKKESVESVLQEALQYRADLPEVLLTLGHFKLCSAMRFDNVPMPPLLPYHPWVQWSGNNSKLDIIQRSGNAVANGFELKTALTHLSRAERLRAHDPMTHYLLGWTQMLLVIESKEGSDNWKHTINDAISHFEKVIIYSPMFTPVYFYLGLLRFLLWDLESELDDTSERVDIYSRQAFYQLEHFIDKEWIAIASKPENSNDEMWLNKKPDDFYFDSKHIDKILLEPFMFLLTLERALEFIPVVNLFKPKLAYNSEKGDGFVELIGSYDKTLQK